MSELDKLLENVEVEWKPLGEVVKIQRGKRLVKSELEESGKYAVFQNSMTPLGYYDKSNVRADTTFIISAGSAGEIGYSSVDFWAADDVYYFVTPENINSKFLYYLLLTQQTKITGQVRRASVPRLSKTAFDKLPIPIPPLAAQAEIVHILDTFTELTAKLTAELTAELTARKKQYEYYRDKLLTFNELQRGGVKWKTLGDKDFFEIASGGTPLTTNKEFWDEGNIPWLKSESCNNESVYLAKNFITELGLKKSSAKLLNKDTTLIALVGATIFKTAYLEFEATTNQNIASIKSTNPNVILDKFIFYYLTNLYEILKSEMKNYGMLNLTTLRTFKIPVPPIEEQNRIVSILDKFDTLTTSISEGLPKEIALRKQQYEYYRDKLLTFPKSGV